MTNKFLAATALTISLAASPALAATTFNLEGVASNYYAGSLVVVDGATTLTITPEGNPTGYVYVGAPSVALLGTNAAIGSKVNPLTGGQFAGLRFTFSQLMNSVTFNFGDAGGDSDSPVTITAFSAGGTQLGSVTNTYPTDFASGKTATLTFSGAKYYVATSGSDQGNENSIFYDISAFTAAPGAVPEPATWAMMLLGFGVVGAAMRRRSAGSVRFA